MISQKRAWGKLTWPQNVTDLYPCVDDFLIKHVVFIFDYQSLSTVGITTSLWLSPHDENVYTLDHVR